jgi:hypothetical protein
MASQPGPSAEDAERPHRPAAAADGRAWNDDAQLHGASPATLGREPGSAGRAPSREELAVRGQVTSRVGPLAPAARVLDSTANAIPFTAISARVETARQRATAA